MAAFLLKRWIQQYYVSLSLFACHWIIIIIIIIIITIKIETILFNSTYQSLRAFGGHRFHYQVHINTSNCLQKLIKNLLNIQTTYPIAMNKSYQSFITDIIKLK